MHPDNHKPRKRHTKDQISEWVYTAIDFWTEVLQLDSWKIDVKFDLQMTRTYAEVDLEDAEYEVAEFRFNTRYMRKQKVTAAEVSDIVCHELMHCRLAELAQSQSELSIQIEERTVQNLVRALFRARQVGQTD